MRTFVDGELLTAANLNANFSELTNLVDSRTNDTGWVKVSAATAYANNSTVEYRVKAGVGYLRGVVMPNSGNIAAGVVSSVVTLPEAARPAVAMHIPANGVILGHTTVNAPRSIVSVWPSGGLDVSAEVTLTQVNLSGVSYPIG